MQNQFSPRYPDLNRLKILWRSLRTRCETVAKFMVLPPQSTSQQEIHESTHIYHTKAKVYPYLPVGEEQRDWLEHLYHQS